MLSLPAGETRSEATQRGPHVPKTSKANSSPLCPSGISPKGETKKKVALDLKRGVPPRREALG